MADQSSLSLFQAVENLQHQLQAYDAIEQLLLDRAGADHDGLAVLLGTVTAAVNARCLEVREAAASLAPRS